MTTSPGGPSLGGPGAPRSRCFTERSDVSSRLGLGDTSGAVRLTVLETFRSPLVRPSPRARIGSVRSHGTRSPETLRFEHRRFPDCAERAKAARRCSLEGRDYRRNDLLVNGRWMGGGKTKRSRRSPTRERDVCGSLVRLLPRFRVPRSLFGYHRLFTAIQW